MSEQQTLAPLSAQPVAWRYRYHAQGTWHLCVEPIAGSASLAEYALPATYEQQPLYTTPPPPADARESEALRDVAAERRRQIEREGWTPDHDDEHNSGELAAAATAYSLAAADKLHPMSQGDGGFAEVAHDVWPWDAESWKPSDPRRMLVKAGALILAEIERLDRIALAASQAAPAQEPKS